MSDHQGGMCGINAGRCEDCEREVRLQAVAARARGDFKAERRALDTLALMERGVQSISQQADVIERTETMDNKCPDCGRFANHFNDVWCTPDYWNGIDREVCDDCFARLT